MPWEPKALATTAAAAGSSDAPGAGAFKPALRTTEKEPPLRRTTPMLAPDCAVAAVTVSKVFAPFGAEVVEPATSSIERDSEVLTFRMAAISPARSESSWRSWPRDTSAAMKATAIDDPAMNTAIPGAAKRPHLDRVWLPVAPTRRLPAHDRHQDLAPSRSGRIRSKSTLRLKLSLAYPFCTKGFDGHAGVSELGGRDPSEHLVDLIEQVTDVDRLGQVSSRTG